MHKRFLALALALVLAACIASGCADTGHLAYSAKLDASDSPPVFVLELSEEMFVDSFLSHAPDIELSGESRGGAYAISDFALNTEYSDAMELFIDTLDGEAQSITLTMPLPELESEKGVSKDDEYALERVRRHNTERGKERAEFVKHAEAALRAVNDHKRVMSEADVLIVLANTEKTIKNGSDKSQKLVGMTARSFVLDIKQPPQIVFVIEFIL